MFIIIEDITDYIIFIENIRMAQKKLKPNVYKIIEEVVERGIGAGWNRAHKHTDKPQAQHIKEQIHYYIMLELTEYFIL